MALFRKGQRNCEIWGWRISSASGESGLTQEVVGQVKHGLRARWDEVYDKCFGKHGKLCKLYTKTLGVSSEVLTRFASSFGCYD